MAAGIFSQLMAASALFALPPAPQFSLPDNAVPRKHTVELTIDPSRPAFDGWARIEVELRQPTSILWLNAKDLTIQEAAVVSGGRTYAARATPAGGEFLALELEQALGPAAAAISIRYQGRLDEKSLAGPYRRKVDGEWYAYTTFTPIDARRAFPCFDEPRFKTPWEIAIRVKRSLKAFSNAPEVSETDEADGMKLIRFAPTQPLPAEVVAFAAGPFDVYEGSPNVRVLTPKGRASEGHAAVQSAATVLPRLEAYTGIPYPFGKLDHLAMPEGTFGAVENPGLIAYRLRNLLMPPNGETPIKTRALRSLQAHEIGHQWFGNLVTQASWQDVWLSEGLATWLAAKIMDQEGPPERLHLSAIMARERIMTVDASTRSRPVRVAVRTREAAGDIYNRVVYDKGASILTMIEGWLGENSLRDGMRAYLTAHRFGSATTDDLASALHQASGADPSAVLHSFLDSTGVPRVRGEIECDRDEHTEQLRLRLEHSVTAAVPVCWKSDTAHACTVLDAPQLEVRLASCPAWLYLNSGGTGYYRSAYTAEQLAALPLEQLTAAERLTLVYDLRAQKKGRAVLKALSADRDPLIATAAREAMK